MKRLKPEQVIEACKQYQNGISAPCIAAQFNVSPAAVHGLLKRRGVKMRNRRECQLRYEVDEHFFDRIDTEAKAYWLGFLSADGNVHGNALQVVLSTEDAEHLERLKDALHSTHPVKSAFYNQVEQSRLFIRSDVLTRGLIKHGVTPNKTFTLRFPDFLSGELLRHYLRGYVDGDGCFTASGKNVEFSVTAHEQFLAAMQQLLMQECGLKQTKFYYRRKPPVGSLRYCGHQQVHRIHQFLYADSSIALPRKKDFHINAAINICRRAVVNQPQVSESVAQAA